MLRKENYHSKLSENQICYWIESYILIIGDLKEEAVLD
jgi:hypothetical protein